jgi:hypothetical protein
VETLGELIIAGIVLSVLILAVSLAINQIDVSNTIDVVLAFSALSRILSSIVTFPFVAAVTVVIYIDLRGRKEHFDAHSLG